MSRKSQPQPTPSGKPKEPPTRPLLDAGFGRESSPAWQQAGLPFDPHGFPVEPGALALQLRTVADVDTLHSLQAFDTRTTAAAEYERRINALTAEE